MSKHPKASESDPDHLKSPQITEDESVRLRMYTTTEIASILSLTPQTIRRMIHSGRLPAFRVKDKKLMVSENDLTIWLEKSRYGV